MAFCASTEEPGLRPRRLAAVRTITMDVAHPQRRAAERLIEGVYLATFDARLHEHFPTLIGVTDSAGEVIAVAGCRFAASDRLFLESYLDEPVETALSRRLGAPIERNQIGEIGSLASAGGGAAVTLFAALARHLDTAGVRFAVATATGRLRRAFSAFGLCDGELAKADPARAPRGADWGRYYENEPAVLYGRVAQGCARLAPTLMAARS